MKAKIVDGQEIASDLIEKIRVISQSLPPKRVCFVSFGGNSASKSFVERKMLFARELGIEAELLESSATNTEEALDFLQKLAVHGYDGIVVQLPVIKPLEANALLNVIPKEQDIDMLGIEAKKMYEEGETERMAPVARAVKEILEKSAIELVDKKIVLLGHGRLVGIPVSSYLNKIGVKHEVLNKDSGQVHKISLLQSADIIISGIGVPHYVKPDMIKEGAVLIDAGTSGEEGKLAGDIDPACGDLASLITPVPGGVGPITVASLFYNLYLK